MASLLGVLAPILGRECLRAPAFVYKVPTASAVSSAASFWGEKVGGGEWDETVSRTCGKGRTDA